MRPKKPPRNRERPASSLIKQAADLFKQAIEKDPNYALAYSGLAETYVIFSSYGVAIAGEANLVPSGGGQTFASTKALAVAPSSLVLRRSEFAQEGLPPMIALGADGVIAVISNEAPALFVELVNGALKMESAPGKGTKITVLIPLSDEAREKMGV